MRRGWISVSYTHFSLWPIERCVSSAAHGRPLIYPPHTAGRSQGHSKEEEHTAEYRRRGRGSCGRGVLLGLHDMLGRGSCSGFHDGCMFFLCLSARGGVRMDIWGAFVRPEGALLRFACGPCTHDRARCQMTSCAVSPVVHIPTPPGPAVALVGTLALLCLVYSRFGRSLAVFTNAVYCAMGSDISWDSRT